MGRVKTSSLGIDFSRNGIANIEKATNDNKIIQIINSKNMPVTTNEINIKLKLVNNKWLIIPNSSLIRAITGNFINIIDEDEKEDNMKLDNGKNCVIKKCCKL